MGSSVCVLQRFSQSSPLAATPPRARLRARGEFCIVHNGSVAMLAWKLKCMCSAMGFVYRACLLYTSDAADDTPC
eukprot:406362-Pyramimonas_sp.AAC.1